MKIEKTNIDKLLIIQPDIFKDDRGYFFESYNSLRYKGLGINTLFVQDNISKSTKNTIRGLHYQIGNSAQGKLCQVLLGEVLDVAVDVRFGSKTFGKYFSIILSEENKTQLYIPPGFAHGFAVLSDIAIFSYKCTAHYNKDSERTIIYNDSDLNIDWKIGNPILSEKDLNGIKFKNIQKDFTI
ncbi:MAG: dTDP-4-dehydrorhamnose 3,5-epimerase [Ignavibacteriales bacterium]|nr:dTDP-4-dehydrorhamnose 3,5-epimerase [Ignavibacteriales bacterium]